MKLALSNICLNSKEDFDRLVEEQGLAVESAYNKLDPRSIAVQSLFYDMPEGFTFRHPDFIRITVERLQHIHKNTTSPDTIPVVFGSPKVRNLLIDSEIAKLYQGLNNISKASEHLKCKSVLCVENVPHLYGSNVYSSISQILCDAFPLSLDLGNAFLQKDEILPLGVNLARHVHVSAPGLIPISACEDPEYFQFLKNSLKILADSKYSGYISIEMKPCTYWEAKESVLLVKEMLNGISNS